MTHLQFIKEFVGTPYIEPGMETVECVGAVKLYCKKRGFSIKAFGGSAINGWNTGCPFGSGWKRVISTPFNYPKEGDIVFWSEKRCKNGHVGVANKLCNPLLLRYIDGNGKGKQDPITIRFGTYSNVLGWFTRK